MKSIVGVVMFVFVCTVFAVNVMADPKLETAYVDVTTQPVSEFGDVGDTFDSYDLSFNTRLLITDNVGVEGVVSTPLRDMDTDTITYKGSVFGRLAHKDVGIEPHVDYSYHDGEGLAFLGVRVGLINRR